MCKNTDIVTLISYKIKEPNFTIQKTDVLFAVISKINVVGVQHHDDFVCAGCLSHRSTQSPDRRWLLSTIYTLQTKEQTSKKTNQVKLQMKCLYVKFHGFSKSNISRARCQKASTILPVNIKWSSSPSAFFSFFFFNCGQRTPESHMVLWNSASIAAWPSLHTRQELWTQGWPWKLSTVAQPALQLSQAQRLSVSQSCMNTAFLGERPLRTAYVWSTLDIWSKAPSMACEDMALLAYSFQSTSLSH